MTDRDIRGSRAANDVEAFYADLFRPGGNHLWTAGDLDPTADGNGLHFAAQYFDGALAQGPSNAVCLLNLLDGTVRRLAPGRLYRNASNGCAAYIGVGVSDEEHLIIVSGAGEELWRVRLEVRVEAMSWSPDGETLLVLAADAGADVSGAEGGFSLRETPEESWLPDVAASNAQNRWRRLYRWSHTTTELSPVSLPPVNIWEAAWIGDDAIVVVASDDHMEGRWYKASLRVLDATSGEERSRYCPAEQIAVPTGSPDGRYYAAIEAFCSDRGVVCGTVHLGSSDGERALDLGGVEASDIRWRDSCTLLFAGVREERTIVGEIDVSTGEVCELWSSDEVTIGGWYPKAVPAGAGAAYAVIEGYSTPPAIARLSAENVRVLKSLAPSPAASIPGTMRYHRWHGRDGLEIGGWLVLPDSDASALPLFIDIHGGPVWAHRNRYAAALRAGPVLVAKGYALLLPNPRGSGGRGQDFARKVRHDMGGEDMHDYLAGIDSLVRLGIVDPSRVAVSGTSYGGFMSSWLVTQTNRFAAAVPISPVANWYSQHFASQIPYFDEALLDGSPQRPGEQYFYRSPVFFAGNASTPTLILAGGRDKNTPTGQAVEFFGALAEAGVETALAVYPEDGHSLRGYPAYLDSAARIVDWLERHIA